MAADRPRRAASADRLAGGAVAALAALALIDVGDLAAMQHAAILVAALSIAALVVVLRTRLR
jgi:hypothetical protein